MKNILNNLGVFLMVVALLPIFIAMVVLSFQSLFKAFLVLFYDCIPSFIMAVSLFIGFILVIVASAL